MIKKKRRKRARRKRTLISVLVFTGVAAVLLLIGITGFKLKEVKVTGNELYTNKQIRESVLNDEYSWNTLYVVLKYKMFKMREIPFIDEMEIEMLSPHKIQIKIGRAHV